jgi:hypothetical protein
MSYAAAARQQWKDLVDEALRLPEQGYDQAIKDLADAAGVTFGALKRKCDAIRSAAEKMDREAIIEQGQGDTLRAYVSKRAKYQEKERKLIQVIPVSLYDAIQHSRRRSPDSEEAFFTRLHRVLGIRRHEEVWEFILSVFADLSDRDLKHLAGMFPEKKKR